MRCSYINVCATFFAAGADYSFARGTLSFTSSQGTASYAVDILPDELTEGLESFGVSLFDIGISLDEVTRSLSVQEAGRSSLQPSTATVSIDDDDGKYIPITKMSDHYKCVTVKYIPITKMSVFT